MAYIFILCSRPIAALWGLGLGNNSTAARVGGSKERDQSLGVIVTPEWEGSDLQLSDILIPAGEMSRSYFSCMILSSLVFHRLKQQQC